MVVVEEIGEVGLKGGECLVEDVERWRRRLGGLLWLRRRRRRRRRGFEEIHDVSVAMKVREMASVQGERIWQLAGRGFGGFRSQHRLPSPRASTA